MAENSAILNNNAIFQRQSSVINSMKFVLIILVLFIHMMPSDAIAVNLSISDASSFYRFATEMISHNLGPMAVPAFFVFSGYFFFYSKESATLDFNWFYRKWKNRLKTILLPYLVWNALYIVIILAKNFLLSLAGVGLDEKFASLHSLDFLSWFWLDPIDFPLWYLRDFLCMIVISPLFYWGFKLIGKWLILILYTFYLSGIDIPVPGLSSIAICFFGVGAILALSGKNLLNIARKVKIPSIICSVVLLITGTLVNELAIHSVISKIFIPIGILAMMNVIDSSDDNLINKLAPLSVMVFFIYAAHAIYLVEWSNGLYMKIFHGSLLGWSIRYFTEPFLVLLICIVIYRVLRKLTPKSLAFLCGGRI